MTTEASEKPAPTSNQLASERTELAEARGGVVESASGSRWLPYEGVAIYFLAKLVATVPVRCALALLTAFISGGVIVTNALMELSEGKDGRFVAFMSGSLVYGLMLVPLG